jgi:hypothetical protein
MTKSNGDSLTVYYDDGPSAVDTTKVVATWNGNAVQVQQYRSFRWRLARTKDVGETVTYQDAARNRLHIIFHPGQSNGEGDGDQTGAPAVVNAAQILPSGPPQDPDPSAPTDVGCGHYLADAIIAGTEYDAIAIHSLSQSATDIAFLSGQYAIQRDRETVLRGAQSADPASELQSGDEYILVSQHGETDSMGSGSADYSADWTTCVDNFFADFPDAVCKAVVVARLPPSSPDDGSFTRWQTIRAEQQALHNPSGTPPVFVVDCLDSDRQAEDLVHLTSAGQYRFANAAYAAIAGVL